MENSARVPGYRQVNLKKTFNRGLRCLLTACSGEVRVFFRRIDLAFYNVDEILILGCNYVFMSLHEGIPSGFSELYCC